MLYPLTFRPLLKERVWGGRKLEALYGKALPVGVPIGESWEVSDRPRDVSTVVNGRLAGKDLHSLVQTSREELLGDGPLQGDRFPLLIKILDAREKLSLQVHPPGAKALELGGEPKTEMWYIAHAEPGAELYVGLKRGTSRGEFEQKLRSGSVEECFHRVPVHAGDAMFLPSGRVHAIGAGLVIFEIQQNSDTTYRVFDWNRRGLDGQPRPLHVPESLASIDFTDFEPALVKAQPLGRDAVWRRLVSDAVFTVDLLEPASPRRLPLSGGRMQILGVVTGGLKLSGAAAEMELAPGQFCLVPACVEKILVETSADSTVLRVETGRG